MGITTKVIGGEHHHHALTDYIVRGELYAAYSNDGKHVWVNWGSSDGYPTGETFANIPVRHIPDLIAALTAVIKTK